MRGYMKWIILGVVGVVVYSIVQALDDRERNIAETGGVLAAIIPFL